MIQRYIFVTGGVVSSLGKGIASATIGALLQARGYSVRLCKLDPYLNIDPGTMSPFQHGEVFVTDDGAETDLDLGHYERFTGRACKGSDNTTTGRLYQAILERERSGAYDGETVQVIPHVTGAIKSFILDGGGVAEDGEIVIAEIGGTVGDIEALPFFEAIRQIASERPQGHCLFVHLTLVPFIDSASELKTKPTQHSVKELRSIGIQPDILLLRTARPLDANSRRKIALLCSVRPEAVIEARDVDTIYDVPLRYHEAGLDGEILKAFGIAHSPPPNLENWHQVSLALTACRSGPLVRIGIVGKYTQSSDAYKSLVEALTHGGLANGAQVDLRWIDSQSIEYGEVEKALEGVDGILVPGGFGERGIEGKIKAIGYARENGIPFFGICLGMQLAVIEFARHVLNLNGAGSSEFDETCSDPIVGLLTEWVRDEHIEVRDAQVPRGGTLRLGSYPAVLTESSKIASIYEASEIMERHRHRYEVNIAYEEALAAEGMRFCGRSPDGLLPETLELDGHPWFIGVQYHPEFKSRPFAPHRLFSAFVAAALANKDA